MLRTITLGVSIADAATPTALKLGVPVLAHLVPAKYQHWIPAAIKNFIRGIGVALAWKLQVTAHTANHEARMGDPF